MKQEITQDQWDELDNNQKRDLSNFFKLFGIKPNIGEMIEFLGEDLDKIMRTKRGYTVTMHWKCADYAGDKELVNALWKHVKAKLFNN